MAKGVAEAVIHLYVNAVTGTVELTLNTTQAILNPAYAVSAS